MFSNVFIKTVKMLLKDKALVFWMLLFPLVLSTLFFVAFSNLSSADNFKKARVAVVYSEAADSAETEAFRGALAAAGELFIVSEASETEALAALDAGEADAVIAVGQSLSLTVRKNELQQSIVKSFLDEYAAMSVSIRGILAAGGTDLAAIYADLAGRVENFAENGAAGRNTDTTVIYYYALLGMSCFYFSMGGKNVIDITQPNQTKCAQRASLSPAPRATLFTAVLCAHLVVLTFVLGVILCYLGLVIRVDFGTRIGLVILAGILGMLVGVGFGMVLGASSRKSMGVKTAIMIGVTMVFSVLAGLMSPDLKYSVNAAVPWLRFLNPVALISDCFYALYYYESLAAFGLYAGVLTAYIAAFYLISVLLVRRKRYASI